nr:hypothetical protein [uncultured Sphingomonas sp.]
MGVVILLGMAAVVAALLWLMKVRGPILTFSLAALAFGCAGYMTMGRPDLPGSPREGVTPPPPLSLAGARRAFLGQFDNADVWLTMSENMAARGNTRDAAGIMIAATREHPGDYKLWIGLGNALTDQSKTLSPSARFAFERAKQLAPGYPAPLFFYGLAEARSGNPEAAARMWNEILLNAPVNASWRPLVENGLLAIGTAPGEPAPTPIKPKA